MHFPHKIILFALVLMSGFSAKLLAQRIGVPLFQHFAPEEYNAHYQNFNIAQDADGRIYVGNVSGLLMFDGANWQLYRMPNDELVRCIKVVGNRIYVGGWGEFGYFQPNLLGNLEYVSLSAKSGLKDFEIGDVWFAHQWNGNVYFQTFHFIFKITANEEVRILNEKANYGLFSKVVNNRLYVPDLQAGLRIVGGDEVVGFIAGSEMLTGKHIKVMLPWKNGVLIGANTGEMFFLDQQDKLQTAKFPAASYFKNAILADGLWLPDSTMCFSTRRGGLAITDQEGNLIETISKAAGLPDEDARDIFLDQNLGVWMATPNGVIRVEVMSNIRLVSEVLGYEGIPLAASYKEGYFYIGTSQGLFAAKERTDGRPLHFQKVPGINSTVFGLSKDPISKSVIACSEEGFFEVDKASVFMVIKSGGYMAGFQNEVAILGGWDGALVARRKAGKWKWEGVIQGITEHISTVVTANDSTIWLGCKSDYVIKAEKMEGSWENAKITRYGAEKGIPVGLKKMAVSRGKVYCMHTKDIYSFNQQTDTFEKVPFPEEINRQGYFAITFDPTEGNILVAHASGQVASLHPAGHKLEYTNQPYLRLPATNESIEFLAIFKGFEWIFSNQGVYVVTPKAPRRTTNFNCLINNVQLTLKDSIVATGMIHNGKELGSLLYENRGLSFRYSAPFFEGNAHLNYRYLLDGFDDNWSSWSTNNRKEYSNLPAGNYTFRVQAKNIYQQVSSPSTVSFTVLPAWYQTWWAITLFAAAGVTFIGVIVRYFATRKLIRRVEELELIHKVQQERERISRDLHDNIGSQLTYIISNLDYLAYKSGKLDQSISTKADKLGDFARDTMRQLRQTIWTMNKEEISLNEMVQKMEEVISRVTEDLECPRIQMLKKGNGEVRLKPTLVLNLLRITQEAVNNAIKYAEAKNITVMVENHNNHLLALEVTDNGNGFEPATIAEGDHYGLENMKRRAESMQAGFQLTSTPGQGTRIRVDRLPLATN